MSITRTRSKTETDLDPYVVAIGASAGGMEAVHELFDKMPDDTGFAFIIIQHLSPDHKSMIVELLAKHTKMHVIQAEDNLKVESNCVYVIPNDRNIEINRGFLKLIDKAKVKAPNLAIDIFLESLAKDKKNKAVAIILSGTGSDGTRGIHAIKDNGGLVFVQEPQTAKFDGMPLSAIGSGKVDFILPAESIPEELIAITQNPLVDGILSDKLSAKDEKVLLEILDLIKSRTTNDFNLYKRPTVIRRLTRRMSIVKKKTLSAYLRFLQTDPDEIRIICKEFLIGVTQFFRDIEAFELLRSHIIPGIIDRKQPADPVKVWVAACSTGEEAYSIAILFKEYAEKKGGDYDVKIFASDMDRESIDFAARGVYPATIEKSLSGEVLNKYFIREGDKYKISAEIRKMIIFSHHDLMKDAPYSKMDLITCRNMLIYLNPVMQKRCLNIFHFGLNVGGYLFLGPSENIGDLKNSFKEISKKWKIYQSFNEVKKFRLEGLSSNNILNRDQGHVAKQSAAQLTHSFSDLLSEVLLDQYDSAGIYIDPNFNLLETFGNYKKYLDFPDRKLNLNLLKLMPADLSVILGANIRKAINSNTKISLTNLKNKSGRSLDVVIKPFDLNAQKTILIVFSEHIAHEAPPVVIPARTGGLELDHYLALEQELSDTKKYLQNAIEESETANEELQSANEELISANEELQSTNEELQSLNEELHTVNAEHQQKIKEVVELNDDLNNYIKSTDIGQIFLDKNLLIRRFTPTAAKVINLIESDIGRPISHIASNMKYPEFFDDLEKVLEHSKTIKRSIKLNDNSWFQVKIVPYLKEGRYNDGVVLTFVDITDLQNLSRSLEKEREYLKAVLENVEDGIVACDENGNVSLLNKSFRNLNGFSESRTDFSEWNNNFSLYSGDGSSLGEKHDPLLTAFRGEKVKEMELVVSPQNGEKRNLIANGKRIISAAGKNLGAVVALHDITEKKKAIEEQQKLKALIDNSFDFIGLSDLEGKALYINKAGRNLIGLKDKGGIQRTNIIDYFPPKMAPFIKETVIPIVMKHEAWSGDVQFKHLETGELIDVSWNVFLVKEEHSLKPIGIGFVSQDLRQKKKAEQEIKKINKELTDLNNKLEERVKTRTAEIVAQKNILHDLFTQAPALICTLRGPEHVFDLVNPLFQQFFGKRQLGGKTIKQALPELESQGFLDILDNVYKTGKSFIGKEIRLMLARDENAPVEEIYMNFIYQATYTENKKISGILVFAYEVTEQVNAGKTIQKANKELQKLIEEFKFVTDFMPQLVWATQPDGYHDFYNNGWYKYTGLSYETTKGEGWNNVLHPEDKERAWKIWSHSLQTGEPYEIEYRFRRHDGEFRWFLGRALPLKDENGKILKWFGTCTDIHDQKIQSDQLEQKVEERTEELREANENLQRSNKELERFAYIASHDLQEPLRKIRTFLHIVEDELKDNITAQAKTYIDKANQSSKKITELVRDILNYSRLQQSGLQFIETNLNNVIDSVKEDLELLIKQKAAVISHSNLPTIQAIPLQMGQLFYNLLSNSLKFTRKNVSPEITIESRKMDKEEIKRHPNLSQELDYWVITVRDNGIGFEQKYAEQIFTIFQRLNPKTQFEGTGIGLALCKKILENHKGEISAESLSATGASFVIILPEKPSVG